MKTFLLFNHFRFLAFCYFNVCQSTRPHEVQGNNNLGGELGIESIRFVVKTFDSV